MFSGLKLLFLFAVLWLVWLVFRLIDRRNRTWNAGQYKTAEQKSDGIVELAECEGCGAYVTAAGCDNSDCSVNS